MPQIIMLNHAATVNRENSERRAKASSSSSNGQNMSAEEQRIKDLSPTELSNYMTEQWE